MHVILFTFAVLLVGAQADSYGTVGSCGGLQEEYDYDYDNFTLPFQIYPIMYVHSVTKLPDSELVDGIVVNITIFDDGEEVIFKSVNIHTKDGSVETLAYQDIVVNDGLAQEYIYDPIENSTLKFYLLVVGEIQECGVVLYFRCSESGTLTQDVLQVLKKEKAPLSDECEAKVTALVDDAGFEMSQPYVLPYALNNYS